MNGDLTLISQPGFQRSWSALAEQFRDLIFYIKPMISLKHESDLAEPEIIDLLSDDEGSVDITRPSTPVRTSRVYFASFGCLTNSYTFLFSHLLYRELLNFQSS